MPAESVAAVRDFSLPPAYRGLAFEQSGFPEKAGESHRKKTLGARNR
jgi:hypothetical protein